MPTDPHVIIWEFSVPTEHTAAFIAAYGPSGAWARLFGKAAGYSGTELYRDRAVPGRFVTVDSWLSPEAYAAFQEAFGAEYQELDRACEPLTASERALGTFAVVPTSWPGAK